MASARNLCQHSDHDGTQCTSTDYILCPHCQLQLCLKHLNYHQMLLRTELYTLCDDVDCVQVNLAGLTFDSTNHRHILLGQLDKWYDEQIELINKMYAEKKQQIQTLYIRSRMEFDIYKFKKEKQLKDNLIKQLNKVLKQKQIHIDDLNVMKTKLDYIQRGLDELKQLKIEIQFNKTNYDVNIVKRRYVEAAKPLFNDDDDNLWETDNEEEETVTSENNQIFEKSSSCQQQLSSFPSISLQSSSSVIVKKPPLKLVIKRLQHPTISTEIKYKLQTKGKSLSMIT